MRPARWWCAAALIAGSVLIGVGLALADGEFSVAGGVTRDGHDGTRAFYYHVEYQGQQLADIGKAFGALPNPNDPLAKLVEKPTDAADVLLHFERGSVTANGDLFSATGLKPLGAAIPALGRLRGTAQAVGRLEPKSATYALGLETPPFHPLAPINARTALNAPNWIVLGIQAERRDRDSTHSAFTDGGAAQARWYLGWSPPGGWRHSQSQRDRLASAVARLKREARTFREALALDQQYKEKYKDELPPPFESELRRIVAFERREIERSPKRDSLLDDPGVWGAKVDQWADVRNLPADQPRASFQFDGYVRRQFGADRVSDAWLQLVRAQLLVWLFPERPDEGCLVIAYVNGFDKADPAVRRNQALLTLEMKF